MTTASALLRPLSWRGWPCQNPRWPFSAPFPRADLTLLAINNNGSDPARKVFEVLHNGTGKPFQGQGPMPGNLA